MDWTALRFSVIALSLALVTAGCGKREPELPQGASEVLKDKTATPGQPATPTPATTTGADTTPGAATTTGAMTAVQESNIKTFQELSKIPSIAELIKKNDVPRQTMICNVGGDGVSVAEYRLALKVKQDQIKAVLQQDPSQRLPLIEHANKENVQLSEEEKKNLITQGKTALGASFDKVLQQHKLTEKQFEDQLLEMGRALKTATRAVEKKLISEMINNSLLVDAARSAGLAKSAFNRYIEFKHSPAYEQVANVTDLTQDQLRDKIIEEFLSQAMQKKIVDAHALPDSQVLELYTEKKDQFKHKGRIRWSQIVIAAPTQDMGAVESVQAQVARQFPEMKGEALAKKVKETEDEQKKKAAELLAKIQKGQSFAEVANSFTDDIPARVAKKGGDMGYIALDDLKQNQLLANVGEALQKMKVGELSQAPIQTPFGWHIIKLTDRQSEGIIPFAEVKDDLKRQLVEQQANIAISAWLIEKRKTVPIRINPEFQKYIDGKVPPKKTT